MEMLSIIPVRMFIILTVMGIVLLGVLRRTRYLVFNSIIKLRKKLYISKIEKLADEGIAARTNNEPVPEKLIEYDENLKVAHRDYRAAKMKRDKFYRNRKILGGNIFVIMVLSMLIAGCAIFNKGIMKLYLKGESRIFSVLNINVDSVEGVGEYLLSANEEKKEFLRVTKNNINIRTHYSLDPKYVAGSVNEGDLVEDLGESIKNEGNVWHKIGYGDGVYWIVERVLEKVQ